MHKHCYYRQDINNDITNDTDQCSDTDIKTYKREDRRHAYHRTAYSYYIFNIGLFIKKHEEKADKRQYNIKQSNNYILSDGIIFTHRTESKVQRRKRHCFFGTVDFDNVNSKCC